MNNVNLIQNAIIQLEGGAFQKLFDLYLYKKYKFKNIQTIGVQTGTNKPTKGTPDSYVVTEDGKYILINYGTVGSQPFEKIRADILSCFDKSKLLLPKEKIRKIICGHCSTNIHIEQFDSLKNLIEGVEIELIGIDTLSHDLAVFYPHIAKDELGIAIDTNQFFEIEDFVKAYDANGINAPIDCEFQYRESELIEVGDSIQKNKVTVLTGQSGIGKTRLALETCRKLDDGIVNIFCIKSNGNLMYEDIKYYISDPGKYVVFFDDANMVASLDNVLDTILTMGPDYEVKVLITVRDYAKDRVVNTASKYAIPNIIEIGELNDDEVKSILKSDLGIVNEDYLKKIAEISNGNIRLAFLAGMRSIDDGFQAIRNAEDIFKNYYGKIIDEAKLTKEDILVLFFIAISGPVRKNGNQFYIDLMAAYGEGIVDNNIIDNLYSLELVDWFRNEIAKVADQSLGNYILYYVLFEKKWVNIEELISIGFPRYRTKVVYALSMLIEIFNSKELEKFIKEAITFAWDKAPEEQEMEYLESFYQVNPDKALLMIKNHISLEPVETFDLHDFDFNSKKNYHNISTKEIEILGGYKYTKNLEDAIDLIEMYFEKRPDLIMDFCFVLSDYLLYDRYSSRNKYNCEILLLEKLWCYADSGNNYNNSILYLRIAESALKTEISYTENVRNSRNINFVRRPLVFSEELAKLRIEIWKNFSVLRKNEDYSNAINTILSEVHFNGLDQEESINFLQSDFSAIYNYVIDKHNPNFYDAKIVANYKKVAEQIGIKPDKRYKVWECNHEFKIYCLLTREHLIGRTIEEDEKLRKENISAEICAYNLNDFDNLFSTCCLLEKKVSERELEKLKSGIDCIFEILENDNNLYIKVLENYLESNAPFEINGYCQINYLLEHLGYEATYSFINNKTFDKKDEWLLLIWECISEKDINENVVNDYKNFLLKNLSGDNSITPKIQVVNRYGDRDHELISSVINEIVNNPQKSTAFLGYAYHDDEIETILHFFRKDIDALIKVYINAVAHSPHVDYEGKLFAKIFEQIPKIWEEYVDWIKSKNSMYRDGNECKIFKYVWTVKDWRRCVKYAFERLIADDNVFYIKKSAEILFAKTSDIALIERKKMWLSEKLQESNANVECCKKLIEVVVTVLPDWKLEYILEFLQLNKNIEDFKRIQLFPSSWSWSGSEVPLILEKIDFIKKLKDELNGISYLEHRAYLEEYCSALEKQKDSVELKEYLENADYA